jgi:hypothetical protein
MRVQASFTRDGGQLVPPEQVMTRLMRREPRGPSNYWLDYVILSVAVAGVLLGLGVARWT